MACISFDFLMLKSQRWLKSLKTASSHDFMLWVVVFLMAAVKSRSIDFGSESAQAFFVDGGLDNNA